MQRDREAGASGGAGALDETANERRVARARPFRPVALRPVMPEPAEAVGVRERRNWIDVLLLAGERGFGAAVILLVLFSVIDGPGRDWMRARSADAASSAPARQPAVKPKAQPAPKAALAARAQTVRRPELGASLPSIPRAELQPRAPADYLTPARRYVAGAPPRAEQVAAPQALAPARDLRPTYLRVPRVGIETPVVEVFLQNEVWQVADYAAGYHHGTGVPGRGNVVIAGHNGVRGAVFANLDQVQAGDEIVVEAAGQRFDYRVRAMGRVWPSEVGVMYPTPTPTLTLLTCTNWDLQRFVVIADLVDSAGLQASLGG